MTTIAPTGYAEYPQIAYQNYKSLIAAFMKATTEKKMIICNKKGYALTMKVSECITVPPPPLVFTFDTRLSTAKNDALLARGCTTFNQGKDVYYSIRDYSYDFIQTVINHDPKPNQKTRVLLGTTNLSGMRSFFTCLRIITAFLMTHSYPAFDGPMTGDGGGRYDSIPDFITSKRRGNFEARGGKKPKMSDEDDEMVDYDSDADELGLEDYGFGTKGSSAETVPKAKPTDPICTFMGGTGAAPTLPGLLFPYFPGLLEDDRQFIPSVVRTYFLQCLGNDREEICSAFNEFKGGCGTWASSESGRSLQHVFAGIQMALESQTRLFLINDRTYTGFSLHGWYFHVSIYNRVYVPLEQEKLTEEIRQADEHANAVVEIMRVLKELKVDKNCPKDYKTLPKKLVDLQGPRHLHELICFRIRTEEVDEKIDALVAATSFPQTFRPFTVDNIIKAIDWIVNDEAIPVNEPMFIGGGIARRVEKSIEAFSVFGELGPSFIVPGGRGVKIPPSIADDVQLVASGKGGPPLSVMVLSKKPLISCMNDWDTLTRTGVYLNRVERSAAFKSIRISDKEEIRKLWHCLIDNVGSQLAVVAEGTVGKAETKVLGKRSARDADDEFADFF